VKRPLKLRLPPIALAGLVLGAVVCAGGNLTTVSGPAFTNAVAAADCHGACLTPDGRFVVFVSRAANLVTSDFNGTFDVFLRDRLLGKTTLVSVNHSNSTSGNGPSLGACVSDDGRFVAFHSEASNLVSGDTNGAMDVFLRDMVADTTTLISVATNGVALGNGASSWPILTPDGRFVLFESRASNLDTNDTNGRPDLFVRDTLMQQTTLVTRDRFDAASARGALHVIEGVPRISDDGQWVAFQSRATNLVAGDVNGRSDVFVRDLAGRTNYLVSVNTNGVPANNDSTAPAMSADGRYVAFQSAASDLVSPGRNGTNNIFLRDLISGTTTLINIAHSGSGVITNHSFGPVISADGRYVAFQSTAANLVPGDNLPATLVPALDVFVRDTIAGQTDMASSHPYQMIGGTNYYFNWTTTTVEAQALPISITRDGRYVTFQSAGLDETNSWSSLTRIVNQPGVFVFDRINNTRVRVPGDLQAPALSEDGSLLAFQASARQVLDVVTDTMNIFARETDGGPVELISVGDPTLIPFSTGNALGQLTPGSASHDGRIVAFESFAANLVANDTNATIDVFVHDLELGTNVSLSVNAAGVSRIGPSRLPTISADGRWVAYESVFDSEPRTNGMNNRFTLLAHDRVSGTNFQVAALAPAATSGSPSTPAWSSDGRFLAFRSSAEGLSMPASTVSQVYFRDTAFGTNQLVSINHARNAGGSGPSFGPLLTSDGARVFFLSAASNLLVTNVTGTNLYVWSAQTGSNAMVSVLSNGAAMLMVSQPVITPDGQFALFLGQASPFTALTRLYLWTAEAESAALIDTNTASAALSADGRFVAFESRTALLPIDGNNASDIYLLDRQSGTLSLLSLDASGSAAGNGRSFSPRISPRGRFVVFVSQASNLVPGDTNGCSDVFVRDLSLGTTILASANFPGYGTPNRLSGNPLLSGDGSVLFFESYASDLSARDFNDAKDIFAFHLGPDTEAFRVFQLSRLSPGGGVMLYWHAVPERNYRVQYKDRVDDLMWTDLPGDVTAEATVASKHDPDTNFVAKRFYRVVQVP
jgi:Tol biopolymer transport system component